VTASLARLQRSSPVALVLHFTLPHPRAETVARRALELAGDRHAGDWTRRPLPTVKRAVRKAARESGMLPDAAAWPVRLPRAAIDNEGYHRTPVSLGKSPEMPDLPALFERRGILPDEPGPGPTGPDARDVAGSFSKATRRAYGADWNAWVIWCRVKNRKPFPAAPVDVADFLKDQAEARGLRMSTVRRRLAAIVQVHHLAGHALDRGDPALHYALKRLAREFNLMQTGKHELMTADIEAMLAATAHDLAGARDKALLLMGFAGGFRRSELVALHVEDIDWKRDGIVLTIRRSKTDQEGQGQLVGIRYGMRDRTCPVRALKEWLRQSGITQGPIFRSVIHGRIGDGPLTGQVVANVVKARAKKAGLDPSRVSGHSLRVGHVTQARENGADLADAQRQLRHKRIDTTARYDRKPSALRNSSSGKLGL
jgi:site-specific recombinase XerD